jgi:hypothetical protein
MFCQIYPVAICEALGVYHVIQWLQDMRFDNIDFELDSKITRDAFHSRTVDVIEFGTIIWCVSKSILLFIHKLKGRVFPETNECGGSYLSKKSHIFN